MVDEIYVNGVDCTFVNNQIRILRNCWRIPDLQPCDVHNVFRELKIRTFPHNMYPKNIIFYYTQGGGCPRARAIAQEVYKRRKEKEKAVAEMPNQPERQQYIPRRKGESNASMEALRQQLDGNEEMNENRVIFVTESQLKKIQESLGDKMYDPRKVNIVAKYLDKGFKRGNMACIGSDGYPCDIKIVAMIGSDGNVLRNMTHEQLFYLLQDRFNKIFSEAEKRDRFLRDVIEGWHNKAISKDGIIRITKR